MGDSWVHSNVIWLGDRSLHLSALLYTLLSTIGIEISQYRAAIGRWFSFISARPYKRQTSKTCSQNWVIWQLLVKITLSKLLRPIIQSSVFAIWILIILSGDIQLNPGPGLITVAHVNVRSLIPNNRNKKIDEIETILCNQRNCDVIGITETWLDKSVCDSQVEIDGFQIFRKDRERHGNR